MALGKLRDLLVQHLEHCRALSRVRRREGRGDKCHADRRVGHEEVTVDGLVAAGARTQQGRHLLCEQRAQSDGVELDQFREHLSELSLQVFLVLKHLTGEVPWCQHRVEAGIDRRVDICRQMVL